MPCIRQLSLQWRRTNQQRGVDADLFLSTVLVLVGCFIFHLGIFVAA